MSIHFTVNNKAMSFDGDIDMPLLWYLRDHVKLTGTKYGCGIAECGACTVHIDGRAVRSCVIPLKNIEGKRKSAEAKEKEENEKKDSEKPKLLISPSKKKKLENKTNLN